MDDSQVIVTLTKRNLDLEQQLEDSVVRDANAQEALDTLRGYLDDIQEAVGYDGHYGNLASVIRSKLGKD